jgi:serine protein kinase
LRVTEEAQIYEKLLANSNLSKAACAPGTLDILSKFCVMTRLVAPENSTLYSKMQIYDGVSLKDSDPHARSLQEYRDAAGVDEGMAGVSTRFAFKILSKTFNYDTEEIAANPVHLLYILENEVIKEQYNKERQESYIGLIKGVLTDKYFDFVEKDIRKAFMESFGDMCQNVFETYFHYVNAWVQDQDYRDPATGVMLDRSDLNAELEKIEKPAGIINPKEWRSELVNFVLRKQVDNKGEMPRWDVYERMKDIVEKKVLASTDEILPVISFGPKKSEKEKREHDDFIASMKKRGYTARQCRLLVEWWMRYRKAH